MGKEPGGIKSGEPRVYGRGAGHLKTTKKKKLDSRQVRNSTYSVEKGLNYKASRSMQPTSSQKPARKTDKLAHGGAGPQVHIPGRSEPRNKRSKIGKGVSARAHCADIHRPILTSDKFDGISMKRCTKPAGMHTIFPPQGTKQKNAVPKKNYTAGMMWRVPDSKSLNPYAKVFTPRNPSSHYMLNSSIPPKKKWVKKNVGYPIQKHMPISLTNAKSSAVYHTARRVPNEKFQVQRDRQYKSMRFAKPKGQVYKPRGWLKDQEGWTHVTKKMRVRQNNFKGVVPLFLRIRPLSVERSRSPILMVKWRS
jgi:hypothetical protein